MEALRKEELKRTTETSYVVQHQPPTRRTSTTLLDGLSQSRGVWWTDDRSRDANLFFASDWLEGLSSDWLEGLSSGWLEGLSSGWLGLGFG